MELEGIEHSAQMVVGQELKGEVGYPVQLANEIEDSVWTGIEHSALLDKTWVLYAQYQEHLIQSPHLPYPYLHLYYLPQR